MKSIMSTMLKILLISIMLTGFVIHSMNNVNTYAIEVKGNCNLEVIASEDYVPTDNLNPGDKKTSYLTLINNGKEITSVYINTDIIGMLDLDKQLMKQIQISIFNDDGLFYTGNISDLRDNPLYIGEIQPDEFIRLYFTIYFDKATENEYQGKSVFVKWVFTTVCSANKGIWDGILPKLGDSSILYYIIGICLIVLGLFLNRRTAIKIGQ